MGTRPSTAPGRPSLRPGPGSTGFPRVDAFQRTPSRVFSVRPSSGAKAVRDSPRTDAQPARGRAGTAAPTVTGAGNRDRVGMDGSGPRAAGRCDGDRSPETHDARPRHTPLPRSGSDEFFALRGRQVISGGAAGATRRQLQDVSGTGRDAQAAAGGLCQSRSAGEHTRWEEAHVPRLCLHSHLRSDRGRCRLGSPRGRRLQEADPGSCRCASRAEDEDGRRDGALSRLERAAGRKGAGARSLPLFCSSGRHLLRRGPPRRGG